MEIKQIEAGPHPAVCQLWEESEAGWGTRPDGYSLHQTDDHRREYIKNYWSGMPDNVPAEYSRPYAEPYAVGLSEDIIRSLVEAGGSLRFYANYRRPYGLNP